MLSMWQDGIFQLLILIVIKASQVGKLPLQFSKKSEACLSEFLEEMFCWLVDSEEHWSNHYKCSLQKVVFRSILCYIKRFYLFYFSSFAFQHVTLLVLDVTVQAQNHVLPVEKGVDSKIIDVLVHIIIAALKLNININYSL